MPLVVRLRLRRRGEAHVDSGVLGVVGERRVRGAVERTYGLRMSEARGVTPDDLARLPDEHRAMFPRSEATRARAERRLASTSREQAPPRAQAMVFRRDRHAGTAAA